MSTVTAPAHGHEVHRDYEGGKIGMWIFLFTELTLFGGLFVVYGAYRILYGEEFHHAAEELNVTMGVTNTVVLLTSSLTMVLSISALRRGQVGRCVRLILATCGLAMVFMVIKYFEWGAKFEYGLYPGADHLLTLPKGEIVFFGLYFTMTGLHGFHVLLGVAVMLWTLLLIKRKHTDQEHYGFLENVGLYWHLVDLIWIFLLPLFYLTA